MNGIIKTVRVDINPSHVYLIPGRNVPSTLSYLFLHLGEWGNNSPEIPFIIYFTLPEYSGELTYGIKPRRFSSWRSREEAEKGFYDLMGRTSESKYCLEIAGRTTLVLTPDTGDKVDSEWSDELRFLRELQNKKLISRANSI
ncbi:MAG: hypothetical protein HYW23_00750 [Candidatus Aenigmarchaeota archaeon]|nr:hypothetical protein [Candidatus Aenigmarchaeota archaeon]